MRATRRRLIKPNNFQISTYEEIKSLTDALLLLVITYYEESAQWENFKLPWIDHVLQCDLNKVATRFDF